MSTPAKLRLADNQRLSVKRPYRETPDVVKATSRLILAIGKRVAVEDPEDLRFMMQLEQRVEQAWEIAIAGLRRSGYTDGQIGQMLKITKQAVQKRWPRGS